MTHSFPTRRSADLGAHYLPAGPSTFGRAGAGMDVMFAVDYWYMTNVVQPLPKVPPMIRGVPEPIRFGCMETDLPGVPSREKFLRSEEHTSELQSLMRISYAVFCLKKKNTTK